MSDRQLSFLLEEFLQLKDRITASEDKNCQLEVQCREAQEKNAQLEEYVNILKIQLEDLTQLITEEKGEKQINFLDLLNFNDSESELDEQNGPQINQSQNDTASLLGKLNESIRNLEDKSHELEKTFQNFQQQYDNAQKFDEGIIEDSGMDMETSSPGFDYNMIETNNTKVEAKCEADSGILNEGMANISYIEWKKEFHDIKPEAFTIVYESRKSIDGNIGFKKTNKENQYSKNFKQSRRSVVKSHIPPNSSILRPCTTRTNYKYGENSEPSHTCILCSKSFKKRAGLLTHTFRMHSGSGPSPSSGPSICEICSKCCKSSKGLKRHQLSHLGKKPCGGSDLAVAQSTNLKLKEDRTEVEVTSFNCSYCEIKFGQKSQLDDHIQVHSLVPNECSSCHKVFKTVPNLVKHLWTCHTSNK